MIIAEADGGDPIWYRITELYFADRAALDTALASPEAQTATADYAKIAPPGSRMLVQDDEDCPHPPAPPPPPPPPPPRRRPRQPVHAEAVQRPSTARASARRRGQAGNPGAGPR